MHVLYSPQRSDKKITYTFDGEKITVERVKIDMEADEIEFPKGEDYTEIVSEYDFSQFPEDGVLEEPPHPIVKAERVDGELYVTLINYIGKDATEEERFPEWQVID